VTSTDEGGYATIGASGDYEVTVTVSGEGDTSNISFSVTEPTED